MPDTTVLIIGAGLAGLTCARHLHRAGFDVRVLEAADAVGGRVRTDEVDGFFLDRGFQVLPTAYPEAQAEFDYDALDLHPFYDGALVRFDGRFHRMADPFRHPLDTPGTILSPIGTFRDKLRVAKLRTSLREESLDELFTHEEMTTLEALRHRWGFSDRMIERFFRPFFGGVFFDPELETSSRLFEFIFRMFADGPTALAAEGMAALPKQLAANLPPDSIRLHSPVQAIQDTTAVLRSGEQLHARAIVVATDAPSANVLLGDVDASGRSTTCLYYAADEPPIDEPILVLNGDGEGLINNLCVLSNVAPSYAPPDQSLISVVVLGLPPHDDAHFEDAVREQLADWFGSVVETWRHLRTYRLRYALPQQKPSSSSASNNNTIRRDNGHYVCGDYCDTASLNGALASGRRAAQAVMADLAE